MGCPLLSCAVMAECERYPFVMASADSECLLSRRSARRCYGGARDLLGEALRDETPLSNLASGFGRRGVVVRPR